MIGRGGRGWGPAEGERSNTTNTAGVYFLFFCFQLPSPFSAVLGAIVVIAPKVFDSTFLSPRDFFIFFSRETIACWKGGTYPV